MTAGSANVVLSGDIDIYRAPTIRPLLDAIDGRATIDMRTIAFIDSAGLSELARVARRVGVGEITLVIASKNVRRVLELVSFDTLFVIVEVSRPNNGAASTTDARAPRIPGFIDALDGPDTLMPPPAAA